MGFSSFPMFLDPPNWTQLMQQQFLIGGGEHHHHHHLMLPPSGHPPPLPAGIPSSAAAATGGGSSSCNSLPAASPSGEQQQQRPVTSMTERARLARVPLPEPGTLRCPRCDSANTKFCYFNNYSLSQPRHFCKACRRYWTRGGALRNVPVGGGCRRNTKRSSKKSSRAAATSSSSTTTTSAADAIATMQCQALPHHLGALEASMEGYHNHNHSLLPFQLQPQFLHGYLFADGDVGGALADGFPRGAMASGLLAQLASIKMEEHGASAGGGASGFIGAHEQPYEFMPGSGGGWPTEFLSEFSNSSSGNVL